ncbi:hypothetical protein RB594_006035 [Gaeumannomyces avenae]
MPQTAEEREAQRLEAARQVRFNPRDLYKALWEGGGRRSTLGGEAGHLRDLETTTETVTLEDGTEPEAEHVENDYAKFKDHVTNEDYEAARYTGTTEDQANDLKAGIEELASKLSRKNGPALHYIAITESAKARWPDFNGPMTRESFDQMVDEGPQEMFEEFKFRSLAFEVSARQTAKLHEVAKGLDKNMNTLHKWAEVLGARSERATATNANTLADTLNENDELTAKLEEALRNVKECREAVTDSCLLAQERDKKIKDLEAKLAQLGGSESGESGRHHREYTPQSHQSGGSGRSNHSAPNSGRARLKDPPPFYADKEKDQNDFEIWLEAIKDKLSMDGGLYPEDGDKFTYVKSRRAGEAARILRPYVSGEHPDQVKTYQELLDHLWEEHHDGDAQERAQIDLDKLQMKSGEEFLVFKNKFVRLAGECRLPRADWKRNLYRRLVPALQEKVARDYKDKTLSFEGFSRSCQELSFLWEQTRKLRENANKGRESQKKEVDKKSSDTNKPKTNSNPNSGRSGAAAAARQHGQDDLKKLIEENRCFNCREQGHFTRDCPKPKATSSDRVNELMTRFGRSNKEELENEKDSGKA